MQILPLVDQIVGRGFQWTPQIHGSYYFTSLAFGGFGVMTPLFSRSGQRRTDHGVDSMVRGDPEYPWIYRLHLLHDR
jgi:hypothetical protein